jgi:hypothetical protein
MSMNAANARLRQAEKDLVVRWEATLAYWHDENARRFAQDHLEPLLAKTRAAQDAMVHLETILTTLRHECG